LQVRPFLDVIWTREDQGPLNPYPQNRTNVDLQAAIASLSMGPVGIGDSPGYTNVTRVSFISAMDGKQTLKHPSRPMTPIDAMYWPGSDLRPSDDGQVWQSVTLVPTPGNKGVADEAVIHPSLPFQKYDRVLAGEQTASPLDQSNVSSIASHYLQVLAVDVLAPGWVMPFEAVWPAPPASANGTSAAVPYLWQSLQSPCHDGNAAADCLQSAFGPVDGAFGSGGLRLSTGTPTGDNHTFDVYSGSPVIKIQTGMASLLGEVDSYVRVSGSRFS